VLQNPPSSQQVVDEAVGADEIVALASGIGLEPLLLGRYGIERTNQYVFACFSREYDVSTPQPPPGRWERRKRRVELRRARRKGEAVLSRLPKAEHRAPR
jgi:hypothetical protein